MCSRAGGHAPPTRQSRAKSLDADALRRPIPRERSSSSPLMIGTPAAPGEDEEVDMRLAAEAARPAFQLMTCTRHRAVQICGCDYDIGMTQGLKDRGMVSMDGHRAKEMVSNVATRMLRSLALKTRPPSAAVVRGFLQRAMTATTPPPASRTGASRALGAILSSRPIRRESSGRHACPPTVSSGRVVREPARDGTVAALPSAPVSSEGAAASCCSVTSPEMAVPSSAEAAVPARWKSSSSGSPSAFRSLSQNHSPEPTAGRAQTRETGRVSTRGGSSRVRRPPFQHAWGQPYLRRPPPCMPGAC